MANSAFTIPITLQYLMENVTVHIPTRFVLGLALVCAAAPALGASHDGSRPVPGTRASAPEHRSPWVRFLGRRVDAARDLRLRRSVRARKAERRLSAARGRLANAQRAYRAAGDEAAAEPPEVIAAAIGSGGVVHVSPAQSRVLSAAMNVGLKRLGVVAAKALRFSAVELRNRAQQRELGKRLRLAKHGVHANMQSEADLWSIPDATPKGTVLAGDLLARPSPYPSGSGLGTDLAAMVAASGGVRRNPRSRSGTIVIPKQVLRILAQQGVPTVDGGREALRDSRDPQHAPDPAWTFPDDGAGVHVNSGIPSRDFPPALRPYHRGSPPQRVPGKDRQGDEH